jgi:hypothetical protein
VQQQISHYTSRDSGSERAAERRRSPASVRLRRRQVLALARRARAVKHDGFVKRRARQVLRLVLPRLSCARGRSAPPAFHGTAIVGRFQRGELGCQHPLRRRNSRSTWPSRVMLSPRIPKALWLFHEEPIDSWNPRSKGPRVGRTPRFTCERATPRASGARCRTECDRQ